MPASQFDSFLGFYFKALAHADVVGVNIKTVGDGQLINHIEQYDCKKRFLFLKFLPKNSIQYFFTTQV